MAHRSESYASSSSSFNDVTPALALCLRALPSSFPSSSPPFRPALVLPHMPKASVAVRFCPQLFRLRSPAPGQEPSNLMQLPYRLVFAVLTVDSIFVYDTQHHYPIVVVKKQHYAPLTDVAW